MKPLKRNTKSLVFAAMFAALCCVVTYVIAIPLPHGYVNLGDVVVLLAGWCLGGVYGGVAAAVGSALADVLSGYAIYAPATFVVKFCVAFTAYYLYAFFKRLLTREGLDFLPRAFSAIIAELLMVLGYFLYECILYAWSGAMASLLGNVTQGVCCAVGGTIVVSALYPIRAVRNFLPALKRFFDDNIKNKEGE